MGADRLNTSPAEYLDYRDKNRTFTSLAGYDRNDYDLTGSGTPERIQGVRATSNLFATLGVTPNLAGYSLQPRTIVAQPKWRY
jgi:hypothetical protein